MTNTWLKKTNNLYHVIFSGLGRDRPGFIPYVDPGFAESSTQICLNNRLNGRILQTQWRFQRKKLSITATVCIKNYKDITKLSCHVVNLVFPKRSQIRNPEQTWRRIQRMAIKCISFTYVSKIISVIFFYWDSNGRDVNIISTMELFSFSWLLWY